MLHSEYLLMLERARSLEERLSSDDLRGHAAAFLARHWVIADGHLTHILVPVLDSEQEVEVDVGDDLKTYCYQSPGCCGRVVTRPLSDITLYAINFDAWMDEICKQPRCLTLMWFQRNRLTVDWQAQRELMASFEGEA